jgi:predicted dehydrogenase
MASNKGLGRGLGALLGDFGEETPENSPYKLLPIYKVEPNAAQPRQDFDEEELQALSESIQIHGVIQPLTVRELPSGYYQIIAGERRWRAARMANLSEIPAVNSLEEAKQLKAAVLAHPELKYMAAENCFYWAFIQSWKQMYEEGKLGQAVYAEAEYLHSQDFREIKAEDHPKEHWRSFNPAIKYLTHDLGPLLYILDDKCVSVSCMEPDIRYNPYRATPNNGVALFKTAKGAVIRILVCFDAYVHADHNYAIIGTRGNIATDKTVSVDVAHSFASFSDIPGTLEQKIEIPVTTRFAGESAGGHGGADAKMVRDFIKCILNDTKPPIDVDMAIRISLPGIIAHESAVQGGTALEIPEI